MNEYITFIFPLVNFWTDIIIPLLFSFIGAFLAILYTNSRASNIKFSVGNESVFTNKKNEKFKFLHIRIKNETRGGLSAFVRGNITSEFSQIEISWLDPKTNQKRFGSKARWSTQGEPLIPSLLDGENVNFFDPSKAIIAESELIHPGQEKEIDIAIKKDGDDYFYFFNSWSYAYNLLNPNWIITEKSIIFELNFYSNSLNPHKKRFVISNNSTSIDMFKVSEFNE